MILDFVVRPIAPSQWRALEAIWLDAWRATFPHIDFCARLDWFRAHVEGQQGEGARLIGAFETQNGAMAGFALIDPSRRWLDQLAVAPNYFGAGAGQVLLKAARVLCPDRLRLDVNADNGRAARFYFNEGFYEVGRGANLHSGSPTLELEWTAP